MAFRGETYQPKGLSQQYNSQLGAISNMMQGNSAMASNIADNRNATIRALANTFLQEQLKRGTDLAKEKAKQDYIVKLLDSFNVNGTGEGVVVDEQPQPTSSYTLTPPPTTPQIQNGSILGANGGAMFSGLQPDEQFPPLTQNGSTTNWNEYYGVPKGQDEMQGQPLAISPDRQASLNAFTSNQGDALATPDKMTVRGGLAAKTGGRSQEDILADKIIAYSLAGGEGAATLLSASVQAGRLPKAKADLIKAQVDANIAQKTEGAQVGKIKADATTAEVTARNNQVKFAASDPRFLYGGGAKNLAEGLKQSLDPTTAPEATDISGIPLGVPINQEMISYRGNFARLPETRQGEIVEATRDSALTLDRYLDLRDRSLQAAKEGRLRRIQTKIGADGLPAVVLPNDADEAELTAKEFFDARNALAIKRALASGQAANSISNKDAQAFANVIGDPTAPPELFVRQSNAFVAEMLVPSINNAQAVSAPDFKRLKLFYRDLTGEDYKFERTRPITDIVEKMNVRARIRLGFDNNQKFQSAPAPGRSAKPTTKTPPGRLTQILGDLDEEI